MSRRALAALVLLTSACVAEEAAEVDRAAIVGGIVDEGDPAVYYVAAAFTACSGALVSPHVVLTARHCVVGPDDVVNEPREVSVHPGTGPSFGPGYRAAAVYVVPGSTNVAVLDGAPDDLALIVLESAAPEAPFTIDRGSPSDILGQPLTSIGFGRTPEGVRGVKHRVTTRVDRIDGGMFWTPPSVCSGDSGGPGLGPNGHVYGVAVLGGSADCGTATGGYNALDLHMEWIDSVIEAAGDACFPDPEICDGLDDDCDGMVDEDCLPDGADCTDASACLSLRCEDTSSGRICTRACDPSLLSRACADGLRCVRTSDCTGLCVLDDALALAHDAPCGTDEECASGSCVDPGDGVRRCLALCHGDAGQCASGEACTGASGACGACVRAEALRGARGLGEECTVDGDCRSLRCVQRGGIGECATACEGGACSPGFVCQGDACVLDRRQPDGGRCIAATDCASSQCVAQGERGWCSVADCSTSPCPSGFGCVAIGDANLCAPSLALDGESCGASSDCARGACVLGACSPPCERASDCGPGLRCLRSEDGRAASCRLPGAPAVAGCSVGASGSTSLPSTLVFAALLWARRRSRRRTSRAATCIRRR